MKKWSLAVIGITGCLFMPNKAQAQCPGGVTNPNQLLDGTTWVFHTEGAAFGVLGAAAVGSFKAKLTPAGTGSLAITETVNQFVGASDLASVSGRYQVNSDCSGGTLTFMLSSQGVAFEFLFVNASFTEMQMLSEENLGLPGAAPLKGTAKLLPQAQACPGGLADPLQLLNGTTWTFHYEAGDFGPAGSAALGSFKALFVPAGANPKNPFAQGVLTITETVNTFGSLVRLSNISGRYQINSDCSGGTLSIMLSSEAVQFQFLFSNNAMNEMFMASDSVIGNDGLTHVMTGTARRLQ